MRRRVLTALLVVGMAGAAWVAWSWISPPPRGPEPPPERGRELHLPQEAPRVARQAVEEPLNPADPFDPPRPAACLIKVLDSSGDPLADVRVLGGAADAGVGEAAVVLGATDSSGLYRHLPPGPGTYIFSARSAGVSTEPVSVEWSDGRIEDEEVVLRARPATTRVGRVVWKGSRRPVTSPVWVYAWPLGERPDPRTLRRRAALHAPGTRVQTRSDGTFLLGGLPVGEAFEYAVAADGCLSSAFSDRGEATDGHDLGDLTIERLFGLVITLFDSSGGDVLAPPGSYTGLGASYVSRDGRAETRMMSLGPLTNALAGIDAQALEIDGWRRRLVILAGPEDDHEVGPVEFSVGIPGYLPASLEVAVPRIETFIHEVPAQLARISPDVGSIRLVLEHGAGGEFSDGADSGFGSPEGLLSLFGHQDERLEIPIQRLSFDAPLEIRDVPVGHYTAVFTFLAGKTRVMHPERVIVGGGRPHEIVIDAGALGGLEIEVKNAGRVLDGDLTVLLEALSPTSGSRERWLHFDDVPYALRGLAEGSYRVTLRKPAIWAEACEPVEVAVVAGQRQLAEFSVADS